MTAQRPLHAYASPAGRSGMRWGALLLVLAGCVELPTDHQAVSRTSEPARWLEPAVPVCSDADLEQPTLAAIDAWAGIGPELVYCGPCSSACVGDPGIGPVVPRELRGIAIAGRSQWACEGDTLGATSRRPTTPLTGAASWLCWNIAARAYDVQSVVTHELGHTLGIIEHADDRESTMRSGLTAGDTSKRDLAPGDLELAAELYPPAGHAAPPAL